MAMTPRARSRVGILLALVGAAVIVTTVTGLVETGSSVHEAMGTGVFRPGDVVALLAGLALLLAAAVLRAPRGHGSR